MSRSKKDEKITELSYSVEALEDHIDDLEGEIADTKAKLWSVICDNDRLTLAFEPYIPPGHEDAELTFYGLKEENDMLMQKVLDKMELIDELDKKINILVRENYTLDRTIRELEADVMVAQKAPEIPVKAKKVRNDRWWNLSFELWPGAWGLDYYRYDWKKHNGVGREGQIHVGPFGFSWNREPKR